MKRPLVQLAGLVAVFAVLSGGECNISGLGDILDSPGVIYVTNVGDQLAVISLTADDVKTYPTLSGGQTASAKTIVGGAYRVTVSMSPENAAIYRQNLLSLRALVESQISGSTDAVQKTKLFLDLSGIKAAIIALESSSGASCAGRIKLDPDEPTEVTATVRWQGSDESGFYDLVCGSN